MLPFLNSLMEPLGVPAHHQQVSLSCWGERFTLALWEWQAPEENPRSLDHDTFSLPDVYSPAKALEDSL